MNGLNLIPLTLFILSKSLGLTKKKPLILVKTEYKCCLTRLRSGKESKLQSKKAEEEEGGKKLFRLIPPRRRILTAVQFLLLRRLTPTSHFPLSCYKTITMFKTLFLLHFIGHRSPNDPLLSNGSLTVNDRTEYDCHQSHFCSDTYQF